MLVASPETLAWLETEDGRSEWLAPLYMPCLVPPKAWTTPFDGGYHTGRVRRLTLVKTGNRPYLHELAEQSMPQVYAAINGLQNTAWAINSRVLETMSALWETRSDMTVIPQADPSPQPNKPGWLTPELKKANMTEAQLVEFVEWKRLAAQVIESNARLKGRRAAFIQMLGVGRRFSTEDPPCQ